MILGDKQRNTDTTYRIKEGHNARIVVDGETTIEVSKNRVIVDVSAGQVVDVSYFCQLKKGEQVHARENTRTWPQPDVVDRDHIAAIPEEESIYIVKGPEWGRIVFVKILTIQAGGGR